MTHDLGFATLTSTTADVNVKSYVALDNNQTPNLDMAYELDHFKTNQVSEEARLTSNGDGPFKWIAGAFYLRERTAVRNDYGLSGFVLDYGAPGFVSTESRAQRSLWVRRVRRSRHQPVHPMR